MSRQEFINFNDLCNNNLNNKGNFDLVLASAIDFAASMGVESRAHEVISGLFSPDEKIDSYIVASTEYVNSMNQKVR